MFFLTYNYKSQFNVSSFVIFVYNYSWIIVNMYNIEVIFEAIFNFYNENKNKNKQKMKYEKSKIAKWKNEDQTSQISDKSMSRFNEKRYMYLLRV